MHTILWSSIDYNLFMHAVYFVVVLLVFLLLLIYAVVLVASIYAMSFVHRRRIFFTS